MNRSRLGLIVESWPDVASRLSGGRDLTAWARACGAFERAGRIRDGATLLRLALAYGCCGLSLRQAALWAAGDGIACLTDEALCKRLAKAGPWLEEITLGLLGGGPSTGGRRLRVVDGTTITAPGATRPTWRLVLNFDPDAQRLCGLSLSPTSRGESLDRCSFEAGELVIADRGFARPAGLAAVRAAGADFLVRLGQRSLRLIDDDGERIALDKVLSEAGPQGIDRTVFVRHAGHPTIKVRLIAIPLPAQAAERNRRKLNRAGQQEGYTPSDAARTTAGYLVLLTSVLETDMTASSLIALYRIRWQVEIAIKRMKSLGNLDQLPARTKEIATTWLHANLIGTILAESLSAEVLDSPPSGPRGTAQAGIHLALGR